MCNEPCEGASGRTRREWLFPLLFGACVCLWITAGLWWCSHLTERLLYEQNRNTARLLVGQAMYNEHLASWDTTSKDKPRPKDEPMPSEHYTLLLEKLAADLKKEQCEYSFITSKSLASAQQDEKRHQKDRDFELKVVNYFVNAALEPSRDSTAPAFVDRLLPDHNKYEYYQPVYADASACVLCHVGKGDTALGSPPTSGSELGSRLPLNEGDLLAIAKITIPFPNRDTRDALTRNQAWLVATAITLMLGVLISYFVLRYTIVWRPKRLHGPAV